MHNSMGKQNFFEAFAEFVRLVPTHVSNYHPEQLPENKRKKGEENLVI